MNGAVTNNASAELREELAEVLTGVASSGLVLSPLSRRSACVRLANRLMRLPDELDLPRHDSDPEQCDAGLL